MQLCWNILLFTHLFCFQITIINYCWTTEHYGRKLKTFLWLLCSNPFLSCREREGVTRSDRSAVLCASLHLSAHAEALLITGHLLSAIRSHLKSCSCQRFYTVWMSEQNSAYAEARLPAVHRAAQHLMMDSPLSTYLSSSFSFNTVQVLAGEWSSCRVLWKTGAIPPLFLYSKNRKWVHWFIERCANIQLNIAYKAKTAFIQL